MASDITRSFESATQIEGSGDGYTTLSGTTEAYTDYIDLTTFEGAHIIVEVDFDATPTDDVKVKLYGSLDGSNPDDTPLSEFTIDNGTDPNQVSIPVRDLAQALLGFQQTGSTDSHNVRAYVREWDWASS